MKKVLFTSHVANFAKFNYPFMEWFKKQGYEVHYASMGEEEIDCDKHFAIPFERSPFKLNNLRAIKQLKKIIDTEDYDIIHTHTPMGSVVTRIAAIAARKKGTRVIYTAHGFHFFKGAPALNWLIFYPIEKIMAHYTDVLVTINKEDYELAKAKFKSDVQYIPGVGIDEKKFGITMTASEKTKLRRSLGLKSNDFVMIYPAEISKRKNQLWLITSLADTIRNDPHYHLLLPGKDSLNGQCQSLVNELSLQNNIHFLGYRRDMPQLFKVSDLAVSTASQEGLPVNIMEAMYTGLPIVATDCRGNADLVTNMINGIIAPLNDSKTFIAGIHQLREENRLRKRYALANHSIIKKYLLDRVLDDMTTIYTPQKTILHLLNSTSLSGAESVACEIIRTTADDYKTIYCSPHGSIEKTLEARSITYNGIKKLSYREIRKLVNQYQPDIIHAHDFRASILASFFGSRVRIISHIHQSPSWLNNPRSINSVLYRLRTNMFHKIIVVTEAIKNTQLFTDISRNKIVVLPNLINTQRIFERSEDSAPKYDVLFCGRLEDVKQPFDFIEIIAKAKKELPKIKAAMIGSGSKMESCVELIHKLGLTHTIDMLGFQENPYKYMKRARILIITSKDEGFGLVATEAAVLGAQVLSYPLPAIRETLGDYGVFGDQEELVQQVLRIMSVHIGDNADSSVVYDKTFDMSLWHQSLVEAYETV